MQSAVQPTAMKFCQGMNVDDPKVNLKGQGHMWHVKVTRSKIVILTSLDSLDLIGLSSLEVIAKCDSPPGVNDGWHTELHC